MAEKNNPNDQEPRGEQLEKGCAEIPLVERQARLRPAECATKGGEYRGGRCYQC